MRFAWKVFFPCMAVLVAALSVISYTLSANAFDTALAQEKQKTLDKMGMLLTVVSAFAADFDYYAGEAELSAVMESVATGDFASARLYDKDGGAVYPKGAPAAPLLEQARAGLAHDVVEAGGAYVMRCCAPVQLGAKMGFLYLEQDVSAPFALSDSMVRSSGVYTLLAIAVAGGLLLLISFLLTRPVRQLSLITRRMAGGDYQARARQGGGDEIGELSADFNRMADSLEAHVEQLEQEARQREDFVSSFAHELKTPLTSIIGYADMLRSLELDTDDRFRSANYIFTEGRRLERLSLKLLELMVLGRQEFDLCPVETEDVARRLEETAGAALKEKYGVSLSVALPGATLLAEPDLLQTLLLNLIDNAGKASARSSPTPMVSGADVCVSGRCCAAGYRVEVSDRGVGIPKEELSRITEAFYMVDKSRARAQNGAGLGLALCDAIARLHKTTLSFESEPGEGTTVSVLLPYAVGVEHAGQ